MSELSAAQEALGRERVKLVTRPSGQFDELAYIRAENRFLRAENAALRQSTRQRPIVLRRAAS